MGGRLPSRDFLFRPEQNARAQAVRLDEALHEGHLIEAGFEEEAREVRERFLAQRAAPVEIVAARQIAVGEQALVGRNIAGKAARDRPHAAGVQRFQQHRVRHQTRDAAVAVKERVNPQQAVMRGGGGKDRVGPAEAAVDLLKSFEKARQRAGADRDVAAHLHVAAAQLAGDHAQALASCRAPPPTAGPPAAARRSGDGVRALLAAAVARPADAAFVDPALHRDVGLRFELKIALAGVRAVVVP